MLTSPNLAYHASLFPLCLSKCLPTSHNPYKLLPSKARNLALVPNAPKVQSKFCQQEKSHESRVQFYQGPWQLCTLQTEPVANPLRHSSPQLSKGLEGLQDIHIRLGFSPPTCHKKEISLQSCLGRYPAFSQYPQGQQTLVGTNGQQICGYIAAPNTAVSQNQLCLYPLPTLMERMTHERNTSRPPGGLAWKQRAECSFP